MPNPTNNFFEKVYAVARQIPYGKVTSYGAIAKALGTARSARMVGWAMNACHNLEDIPAHRVVNRKWLLTGKHHFDGTNLMQQLLENEGIKVVDNQIMDFEKCFWEPEITGWLALNKSTSGHSPIRILQKIRATILQLKSSILKSINPIQKVYNKNFSCYLCIQ